MKTLELFESHKKLGAKMIDFTGYRMPVSYSSISEEHLAVRNSVGLFDVSHMGQFFVTGEESESFLQKHTSNDVAKLKKGKAQYSCLLNNRGGVIDDLIIYCIDNQKYMLVVNASNRSKDWDWLSARCANSVGLEDRSDQMSLLALQGPKAIDVLQEVCDYPVQEIPYYEFVMGTVAGEEDILISATGYTGSGGFELYMDNRSVVKLWNALLLAGESKGILPAGLGARDSLRLEKNYALYGQELTEKISPLEAGLGWITKFSTEFVGKKALLELKESGLEKRLIAFEVLEKAIPRTNYPLYDENEQEIGWVTSGIQSPSLSKGIGMGYVKTGFHKIGTIVLVGIRKKKVKAVVVKKPFV